MTRDASEPISIRVEIGEGVDPAEAIQAAEAIGGIVDDPGAVTVVITDDLDGVARRLLGDASRERDVQRAWSEASGITVDDTIVMAADCFGKGRHHIYVASHEGLHLALAQRKESTHNIRARAPRGEVATDLIVLAGIASEEYRVEQSLVDRFSGTQDALADGFASVVGDFARLVAEASEAYQMTNDVNALMQTVVARFQELLNMTAYLTTARTDAQLAAIVADIPTEIASLVLGVGWQATITAFRTLSSADIRTNQSETDRNVLTVAATIDDWLNQIGFSMTEQDDGSIYFAVLEPETWGEIHEGFEAA